MRGNCGFSEKVLRDSCFAVLRSVLFNGVITSGSIAKEPPSRISTVCGRVRDVRGFQWAFSNILFDQKTVVDVNSTVQPGAALQCPPNACKLQALRSPSANLNKL